MWSWAEQHSYSCRLPFYISMESLSPGGQRKPEAKVTSLPFIGLLPLEVPTWKSTRSSLGHLQFQHCNSDLHASCTLLSEEQPLAYLLNRAKWDNVLDKHPVLELKFQGGKYPVLERRSNLVVIIHKQIQDTWVWVPLLSKLAQVPQTDLSPCLSFPCVKGWQCLLCLFWQLKT